VSLNLDYAVLNEIKMVGVFSHDFRAVRPAIALVRQGRYPFEEMITHRFPLGEAERAIRLVAGEEEGETPIKVLLDPKMELRDLENQSHRTSEPQKSAAMAQVVEPV